MSSYLTFAVFDAPPALSAVAEAMGATLGGALGSFEVERPDGLRAGRVDADASLLIYWNDQHTVEAEMLPSGLLCASISGFDGAELDAGISPARANEWRSLCIDIHDAALQGLGARASWTSSQDDRYGGVPDHGERAARVQADGLSGLIAFDRTYVWLAGQQPGAPVPADAFSPVSECEGVFENAAARPLFLAEALG